MQTWGRSLAEAVQTYIKANAAKRAAEEESFRDELVIWKLTYASALDGAVCANLLGLLATWQIARASHVNFPGGAQLQKSYGRNE